MSYSIEILTYKLNEHKYSLNKSINSYLKHSITLEVHNIHKGNLEPKIKQLEIDINKLNYE